MFLESLYINNFKSIEEKNLSFVNGVNCVVGPNGSGKTNLLDSIYYLSLCKSYFGTPDASGIRFGQQYFSLQGTFERLGERHVVACAVTSDKKKIFKRNDKQYDRLSEHIGLLPLIMITPHDINIINGPGEERRRFFDTLICQLDHDYLKFIGAYGKLLIDRNKILKTENRNIDRDLISVIDERMAYFGQKIYQKRMFACHEITPLAQKLYSTIASSEEISIGYESQLHNYDLLTQFQRSFDKDRALGFTSAGIHRDDFSFSMNGKPIRNFGSQGQKKSFLMSLKFGQYMYTSKQLGLQPILILDDLFDKLDHSRVGHVVEIITGSDFGQIFISDTDRNNLSGIFPGEDAKIIQL